MNNTKQRPLNKFAFEYDCSEIIPDADSISHLNTFLQAKNLPEIHFRAEQIGPQHEPIFWTTVHFENCELYTYGHTKKDCEKKIRTYIWQLISKGTLQIEENTPLKDITNIVNHSQKKCKTSSFSDFAKVLKEWAPREKPILLIDLDNVGAKNIDNPLFRSICSSYNIGVVCLCCREVPETNEDFLVIRRDDLHQESADEGIRRIIYYLIDHLGRSKIGLITQAPFGHALKEALVETDESFYLFLDVKEFTSKYFWLVQGGLKHVLVKQEYA